jgi:hypothetical protein
MRAFAIVMGPVAGDCCASPDACVPIDRRAVAFVTDLAAATGPRVLFPETLPRVAFRRSRHFGTLPRWPGTC